MVVVGTTGTRMSPGGQSPRTSDAFHAMGYPGGGDGGQFRTSYPRTDGPYFGT